MKAHEIASLCEGEVHGDADFVVEGVAPLARAGSRELSFVAEERHLEAARTCGAGALLVRAPIEGGPAVQIAVRDPNLAFGRVCRHLHPVARRTPGVHPTAVIDPEATVAGSAHVGPHCVVEKGAVLAEGVELQAQVFDGEGVRIGAETVVRPQVTLEAGVTVGARCLLQAGARIGSDGFGFAPNERHEHEKIPQLGTVTIEDDVEIGANTCIDRARFDRTVIGRGSKIDNLVQIAHNVEVGAHSILVSQVGIAGSSKLGHHCVLGGHVGIKGHVELQPGAQVGAYSGVGSNLRPGPHAGIPAVPLREALKIRAAQGKLPELLRRVRELERQLAAREEASGPEGSRP
jgi:UDP-3-O-[3-hydroxymyristoyl] glucosamine N-acyltransferase